MSQLITTKLRAGQILLWTFVVLFTSLPALTQTPRKAASRSPYISVTKYDPKRDAARDIVSALKEAQRTRKNVLLEVGGEWCGWCHRLDSFFAANPPLLRLRNKNFVTVKINYSEENENKAVLSQYPPIGGYPHIFFLDAHGKLLLSQDTGVLEKDKGYDLERVTVVLTNWGPKR